MRALQLLRVGATPELVDVPRPVPGPGQVLVGVTAAGLCHTDLHMMGRGPDEFKWDLPFSPGHEVAGVVAELGDGVSTAAVGDAVALHGAWGCGRCPRCVTGQENYCPFVERDGIRRPGLGGPGGVAEYVLVDHPRHLIPLAGLDPVAAVGLTDAGLSSYHAISAELPLLGPGSTALVIGIGGLGHMAVQVLRALTPARIIATDLSATKRELAVRVGAHHVVDESEVPATIADLTGGAGADVVLDFVGSDQTLRMAVRAVRIGGSISLVGAGGGRIDLVPGRVPHGLRVSVPFWGSRGDLEAVLDLARSGSLKVHTRRYALDDVLQAYRDLADGDILGRAVVVP